MELRSIRDHCGPFCRPRPADAQAQFKIAQEDVKTLSGASNENMLEVYALFKQATVGDVNTCKADRSAKAFVSARRTCPLHGVRQ